jgi:hypothetical protein
MDQIIKIINLWDPIGLFPMAPKDEYEAECREIYFFLVNNNGVSVAELSKKIDEIIMNRFGADVYNSESQKKCFDVSREILDVIEV